MTREDQQAFLLALRVKLKPRTLSVDEAVMLANAVGRIVGDPPEGEAMVNVRVSMPAGLLASFFQHIRDYDVAHFDEVQIAISPNAPGVSVAETQRIFQSIKPPFQSMITEKA